jgi:hypothetical protein
MVLYGFWKSVVGVCLGAWILEFGASLDLGFWNLEFIKQASVTQD